MRSTNGRILVALDTCTTLARHKRYVETKETLAAMIQKLSLAVAKHSGCVPALKYVGNKVMSIEQKASEVPAAFHI